MSLVTRIYAGGTRLCRKSTQVSSFIPDVLRFPSQSQWWFVLVPICMSSQRDLATTTATLERLP
eukprot:6212386-Pleurochrysis_carterae.AAC.2